MYTKSTHKHPSAFTRQAWSNLAAQSAEQIGLAATPILAVLVLGFCGRSSSRSSPSTRRCS